MDKKQPAYGGQAVIEGVMMGGKHTTVTAVRLKDHSIEYYECPKRSFPLVNMLKKIPFIRGIVGILEASALGTKHLNFASDAYDAGPKDRSSINSEEQKKTSNAGLIIGIAIIGVLSFIFAKFVFTIVPAVIADLFKPIAIFRGQTSQILLEGFFKVILLLGYIYFVSLTPLMKRVFQYHGAEHKVINAFENDVPLTVENVQKQSRLHYRCGSSYILFTAIISIALYFFVPIYPLWLRLIYRILLIPVDLGIAYEVLRFTNKLRHIPVLKWLGYPGLWLQLLTTKEPEPKQIEVAICAFEEMRKRDAIYEKSQVNLNSLKVNKGV
ncbi:uncharacterized protein YqhQ [Scopulibacillus daqui]|uniref:Uncharacterized protein YqhQ n=1 Tax=Scopulibacillus daqui TaxID=1469162 RepID=A0ABS2Q214_9BACL|nr:DUF1385 domain-containing protein [Scopulibacillus daqui]MBM7646336.1 uncharacterized protein YqhQ [Scopulibacillus daqui]